MSSYSKKKDLSPTETVRKIKGILQGLGLTTREVILKASDNCYSCGIDCNEYDFLRANGKGTSLEYVLASGYAEFIERLQNWQFKLGGKITDKYRPDIVLMDSKKLVIPDEDVKEIIKLTNKEELLAIPIYDVNGKSVVNYPFEGIINMGSNGMCAGNTPEEAIVQGLSEIFERYACRKIREDHLTPPDIPREEYIHYPEIRNMIEMYENLGFTLYIKDASLGLGLPVVCVAIFDKEKGVGVLRYGSQPILPIAIERCLTEFSQGHDWKRKTRSKDFFIEILSNKTENIIGFEAKGVILGRGLEYASPSFFGDKKSWEYDKNTFDSTRKTNKGLCKSLVNKIKKLEYNIYIRDVSFLGFCSYHIIVPQMDCGLSKYGLLKELAKKLQIKNKEVLNCLVEGLSFMVELAIFFNNKEYQKCIDKISFRLMENYPYLRRDRDISNREKMFLRIINKYAELKLENCWSDDEIKNALYTFYEPHHINYFYDKWVDNDPFIELLRMTDEMIVNEDKILEEEERKAKPLLTLLAERYKANPPDQMAMKKFFDALDNLSPEEEFEPATPESLAEASETSLESLRFSESSPPLSNTFSLSTNFKL